MLLSDEWKDERIWPRGDIGITKHKKDTAKIRSLKLSSNSSKKWWLHNLLYFCEKTQRLHTNCLMLLKMCSELKIINWWVNINWATIFFSYFKVIRIVLQTLSDNVFFSHIPTDISHLMYLIFDITAADIETKHRYKNEQKKSWN